MKKYFNGLVEHAAILHAQEEYPKESCGLVVNNEYIRCENIKQDKEHEFKIDKEVLLKYYNTDGGIQAIIHSHCNTEMPYASGADITMQMNSNIPWGIVDLVNRSVRQVFYWGDQLDIQDLLGRPFVHGVYDCFGLVRDYYRLQGHDIPNYPRDWNWWQRDENVIMDGVKSRGFELIHPDDIQPGDGVIGKIKYKNPNHCGVYLGNGLLLHHWAGKNDLSCEIPYNQIKKFIIYGARYNE